MKKLLEYNLPLQSFIEHSDCFQATLNTITYNIGDRHELMPFLCFSNYSFDQHDLSLCFDRTGRIPGISDDLLSLTGIRVEKKNYQSKSELFDLCFLSAKKQIPIVINIDSFDIPYHLAYKKDHLGHYFIVLSLEPNGHCIYIDPYFNMSRVEAKFDDMSLFYDHYLVYTADYQYKRSAQEIVVQQLDYYIKTSFAKKLEGVGALLLTNGMFESMMNKQNPVLSPFMLKLKRFITERKNLLYCSYRYFSEDNDLLSKFELCVKDWNDVYLILLKSISRNFRKSITEKAVELLSHTSKQEEAVISKLKHIVGERHPFV